MAPMWMGLLERPSATSLPVASTERFRWPPMRISAQGSMVSVPEILVLRGTLCGLPAAVQVSVPTVPGWSVGPLVGAGQPGGASVEPEPQASAHAPMQSENHDEVFIG